MKKIVLDTNALMAVSEFKLDIFTVLEESCDFRFKVFLLSGVIDELQKILKEQRGKYKEAAKLALSLIRVKKIPALIMKGNVDDELVRLSKKNYLVLTQDVALKKRLQKPYLTIRQKKKVVVIE